MKVLALILFLTSLTSFAGLDDFKSMTGEFVELKDESLKECFTYKKITFKKSIPWKFKENLYLVEIDDKKTGQLAAIATSKKYKPEAFVVEFRLAATGGLPYTDKTDKKKFIQMFIECKN